VNRILIVVSAAMALAACGKSPAPPQAAATSTPAATAAPDEKPAARSQTSAATSAGCRTSPAPVRLAAVTEADLMGVPMYPGAATATGTVVSDPHEFQAAVQQTTNDPPEKVLSFYRERLKAQAAGRELVDSGAPNAAGTVALELSGRSDQPDVQVVVTGNKEGSAVQVSVSCSAK
jgi:hypothetical protein